VALPSQRLPPSNFVLTAGFRGHRQSRSGWKYERSTVSSAVASYNSDVVNARNPLPLSSIGSVRTVELLIS